MKNFSTSLLVFGLYLIGMGAGLVLTPGLTLSILGFSPTGGIWPRVVGVLAIVLAFYYISASRAKIAIFAQWTVPGRIGVFLAFCAFVIFGLAGPIMILLGFVDLLGALWTGWALKAEK